MTILNPETPLGPTYPLPSFPLLYNPGLCGLGLVWGVSCIYLVIMHGPVIRS
jgi:hypothetical protein